MEESNYLAVPSRIEVLFGFLCSIWGSLVQRKYWETVLSPAKYRNKLEEVVGNMMTIRKSLKDKTHSRYLISVLEDDTGERDRFFSEVRLKRQEAMGICCWAVKKLLHLSALWPWDKNQKQHGQSMHAAYKTCLDKVPAVWSGNEEGLALPWC